MQTESEEAIHKMHTAHVLLLGSVVYDDDSQARWHGGTHGNTMSRMAQRAFATEGTIRFSNMLSMTFK